MQNEALICILRWYPVVDQTLTDICTASKEGIHWMELNDTKKVQEIRPEENKSRKFGLDKILGQ